MDSQNILQAEIEDLERQERHLDQLIRNTGWLTVEVCERVLFPIETRASENKDKF